jgi:hypothetical protein
MSSFSDSDYRKFVADYIDKAIMRPSMYYRSLYELEALMGGHAFAFGQIGAIGRQTFNAGFGDWLYRYRGVSAAAGWARAIDLLKEGSSVDPNRLFADLVRSFLSQWSA